MPTAGLDITFARKSADCRIVIEDGLLSRLRTQRDLFSGASAIAVVTDDVVSKLYAAKLKDQLSKYARTHVIAFPHGERNKNLKTCDRIASQLSDHGLDRKSMIVALGGGVVGDVAGFVASIFKRGIKYVQAPTTLLAQVDSSLGGKTGVDTEWGKNQLGTFYQPKAVLVDTSTLDTLPDSEIINGLAEMVKSGIIADKDLFHSLDQLDYFDARSLKKLVLQTCWIKARVVERDELEENLRTILNYGHTIGHAIEASSNYRLSHGKAVVLGMVAEGWIAEKLGFFRKQDHVIQTDILRRIIKTFGIRATIDDTEVMQFAKLDKKSAKSTIRMALPERIGKMHSRNGDYLVPVAGDLILESLQILHSEL